MANLNQKIPVLPQPAIASYDWVSAVSRVGYIKFFAAIAATSSGDQQILTTEVVGSKKRETERTSAGETTLTFDSLNFQTPSILNGTAYFSAFQAAPSVGGSSVSLKVQLFKYDGTTATSLADEITGHTYEAGGAAALRTVLIPISLTNKSISVGEKLRLVVKLVYGGTSTTGGAALGHDPLDRVGEKP